MSRKASLVLLFAAAVGLAGAARWQTSAEAESVVVAAAPIERAIPEGAAVAEDEATLTRWLADPRGPREIWLLARDYRGDFVAQRPVALRGRRGTRFVGSGRGTVITLAGPGSRLEGVTVQSSGRRQTREDAAVRATAPDVVIENVTTLDSLFGIVLGSCARCRVERAHVIGRPDDPLQGDGIKLWEANDAVVRDCVVEGARDLVVWYSRRVLLSKNRVTNSRYGTHFMYAHDSVVRDSELSRNTVGIFVMYSSGLSLLDNRVMGARGPAGMGIGFKESDAATIRGNWLVANTTAAYLDRSPRSATNPVRFEHNRFALNDTALRLHSSPEGLVVLDNAFDSNAAVIEVEGGGDALGATFRGNAWSDYQGYDLDGDGRGDVPYQVKALSSGLVERDPSVRLYSGTAAFAVIELVARAAPVFASRLLLIDREPRTRSRRSPS